MFTLKYQVNDNIPVFKCDFCGKCNGIMESTSKLNINRGCCWYFPKYKLVDIKNMLDNGKEDFLLKLFKNPNAQLSQYYLQMIGTFDKIKYNKYMLQNPNQNQDNFDSKLFFRACPFIGKRGCTLDFSLRPHPCNLYLCRTVVNLCSTDYSNYRRERKDYFSYCNYFDESLKFKLMDNHIDLTTDYIKCLDVMKKFYLPKFNFRKLKTIQFIDTLHPKAI